MSFLLQNGTTSSLCQCDVAPTKNKVDWYYIFSTRVWRGEGGGGYKINEKKRVKERGDGYKINGEKRGKGKSKELRTRERAKAKR